MDHKTVLVDYNSVSNVVMSILVSSCVELNFGDEDYIQDKLW